MTTPCRVCLDRLVKNYDSQLGHEMACSVTDITDTRSSDERVYHRAERVQYYGGSWSLNVYVAACGETGLTRAGRGRKPCLTCFPNHPELMQAWKEGHGLT